MNETVHTFIIHRDTPILAGYEQSVMVPPGLEPASSHVAFTMTPDKRTVFIKLLLRDSEDTPRHA